VRSKQTLITGCPGGWGWKAVSLANHEFSLGSRLALSFSSDDGRLVDIPPWNATLHSVIAICRATVLKTGSGNFRWLLRSFSVVDFPRERGQIRAHSLLVACRRFRPIMDLVRPMFQRPIGRLVMALMARSVGPLHLIPPLRLATRSTLRFAALLRLQRRRSDPRTFELAREENVEDGETSWRTLPTDKVARWSINLYLRGGRSSTALDSDTAAARSSWSASGLARQFARREPQDESLHGDANPVLPRSCELAFLRFLSILRRRAILCRALRDPLRDRFRETLSTARNFSRSTLDARWRLISRGIVDTIVRIIAHCFPFETSRAIFRDLSSHANSSSSKRRAEFVRARARRNVSLAWPIDRNDISLAPASDLLTLRFALSVSRVFLVHFLILRVKVSRDRETITLDRRCNFAEKSVDRTTEQKGLSNRLIT